MANEPLEKEAVLAKIKRAWDMPKVFFCALTCSLRVLELGPCSN